jgi:hypothetical protein
MCSKRSNKTNSGFKMSELIIERVPLAEHERILPSKVFPRMPHLYLELFENKIKVKRDLMGKYYTPQPIEEEPAFEIPQTRLHPQPEDSTAHVFEQNENNQEESDPRENTIEEQINTLLGEDIRPPLQQITHDAPTLQELQKKNKVVINNTYICEDDSETQKERNAVYFKYEVLRRMHPNANIPEFTLYSDPKLMSQKYEMITKKLSLDSSVENWKRYMIVFVMGCEVVLGKINFDMEGFAQQQIMSMNTYDQLLVEMAEKSYMPSGSKWSPEIRLFMMVTMNIVLFVISKMIFKKTGANLLGSINSMTGNTLERNMKEPSTSENKG